jgi:hypothetical protein
VSAESIGALTAVRKLGNIGAHMESDVDLIIPVDAGEAQKLIELVEALIEGWYVERHRRTIIFGDVIGIQAEKAQLIADGRAQQKAIAAPDPEEK